MDYVGDIVGRLDIENGAGSGVLIWGDWLEDEPPDTSESTHSRMG